MTVLHGIGMKWVLWSVNMQEKNSQINELNTKEDKHITHSREEKKKSERKLVEEEEEKSEKRKCTQLMNNSNEL